MDPLEAIEALARVARMETAPMTNTRVAASLRAQRGDAMRLAPLAWTAAASALAASIVMALALHANSNSSAKTDSIAPLFDSAQVQMP